MGNPINPDDKRRLFDLRCRSKRGEYLPPDASKFLDRMWKNHPEDYQSLSKEVFEETAPFGYVPKGAKQS